MSRLDSNFFNSFTSSLEHGCLRWQAPELVFPDSQFLSSSDGEPSQSDTGAPSLPKPTTQTDIYALGMTALELITEKKPFSSLAMDTAVVIDLYHNRTPARPSGSDIPGPNDLSDEIWLFIASCWSRNPTERPGAKSISEFFMNRAGHRELESEKSVLSQTYSGDFDLLPADALNIHIKSRKTKLNVKKSAKRSEPRETPDDDALVETITKRGRGRPKGSRTKQTARKSTGGFAIRRRKGEPPLPPTHAGSSEHTFQFDLSAPDVAYDFSPLSPLPFPEESQTLWPASLGEHHDAIAGPSQYSFRSPPSMSAPSTRQNNERTASVPPPKSVETLFEAYSDEDEIESEECEEEVRVQSQLYLIVQTKYQRINLKYRIPPSALVKLSIWSFLDLPLYFNIMMRPQVFVCPQILLVLLLARALVYSRRSTE